VQDGICHRHLCHVLGHVSEEISARGIPTGVDMPCRGSAAAVDDYALLICLDAGRRKVQRVDIRPAANGGQNRVGFQPLAAIGVCRSVLGAGHLRTEQEPNALSAEMLQQQRGQLRIVSPQDSRGVVDHSDVRAQPVEGLGHLHADRPRAHDNKAFGQFVEIEDRLVAQDSRLFGAVDTGRAGRTARRHHEIPGADLPCDSIAADFHRVWIQKAGPARDHFDAELLEILWSIRVLIDVFPNGAHPCHDPREVVAGIGGRESVALSGAHLVRDFRGLEQALARYAAVPGAVAAQLLRLDERRLRAQYRRHPRGREPSRASSDNEHVVVVLHVRSPSLNFDLIFRTVECTPNASIPATKK